MQKREFTDLEDLRLLYRGNKILSDLFSKSVHSIGQITKDDSSAKGCYRFLRNDRASEEDIVGNIVSNCTKACRGKYVVCIQDTTEINLSGHSKRVKKDDYIGTTNANKDKGLGLFGYKSEAKVPGTNYPFGTPHAMDITFKFNNEIPGTKGGFLGGSNPERFAASHNVAELWTTFARTGKPWAKNIPEWPVYNFTARPTMRIDTKCEIINDRFKDELAMWRSISKL